MAPPAQPSPDPIRAHLLRSAATASRAAEECADSVTRLADLAAASLQGGGKLLLCGNGGSAADCQHLAAEFVNLLDRRRPRRAFAALALTTDTSLLTAVANDAGFEHVFQRQVEALGRQGDILIGISTSGLSTNVVRALCRARELGLVTVALTGQAGGEAGRVADLTIRVPSDDPQHVQEAHLAIGHALCAAVEQRLSG